MNHLPHHAAAPAITDVAFARLMRMAMRARSMRMPGWVWVILLWSLFAFPAVGLRGTHYEEGTVLGLARGALEDGWWLAPHLYGERFVERPVLLSWIAAGIGAVTGGVSVWSARLPHLLFLLGGGLIVFNLVRPLTRTGPAVFGALCWFACPMVAQKFITAEPDVTLSVLLFAAFAVWWTATQGVVSTSRWIAVLVLLALAGLTKGPQPLAYFTLGVGSYLLIRRRLRDIPGFVLANVAAGLIVATWYWLVMQPGDPGLWWRQSRLADAMTAGSWLRDHADFAVSIVIEWLPGSLLVVPVAVALWRGESFRDNDLVLALLLYAGMATLALLVWPGGIATRYAMPANLALAALCGIMFDRWWSRRPRLIGAVNTIAITIACYLVILGALAMPLVTDAFRQTRNAALIIDAVRNVRAGPLHVSRDAADMNVLAYVPAPIRLVSREQIENLTEPAVVLLTREEVADIAGRRRDLRLRVHAVVGRRQALRVAEVNSQ